MKKTTLTILLIFIYNFAIFAQSHLTGEEYSIYGIILKRIYVDHLKNNKSKLTFVILDTASNSFDLMDGFVGNIRGLSHNFKKINQIPVKLEKAFPIKYPYEIIGQNEINKLMEAGDKEFAEDQKKMKHPPPDSGGAAWKFFYEKYPAAHGYYQFSRIGFSPNKKFAVVNLENKDAESGETATYILRKIKGRWKIYHSAGSGWDA